MHSFGECPNEERESRLSQILQGGGAPEILFERESVSRNPAEVRQERKGPSRDIERDTHQTISFQERAGKPGGGKGILIQNERTGCLSTLRNQSVLCLNDQGGAVMDVSDDKSGTLRAQEHGHQPCVMAFNSKQMGLDVAEDVSNTLLANDYKEPQAVVYGISAYDSNAMKSSNPNSGIYEAETARTLDLNGGSPACNQGGMAVVCLEGNGSRPTHRGDGWHEGDPMYTLNSTEQHAVCVKEVFDGSRRHDYQSFGEVCETVQAQYGTGGNNTPLVVESEPVLLESNQNHATIQTDGISTALPAAMGEGGGYVPMIVDKKFWDGGEVAHTLTANNAGGNQRMPDKDNFGCVVETYQKTTGSLCASGYDKLGTQEAANDMFVVSHGGFMTNADGSGVAHTLEATDHKDPQCVCYGLDRASFNQGMNAQYDFAVEEKKIGTQVAKGPGAVFASVVRRLTPLECTRLQGYPDGWVDIGEWVDARGKVHKDSDSPKYKALGNSIALPFWRWMAERMVAYLGADCRMASLFDGIGGFPLVFSQCGCAPVWASEIEEFPIAVTKIRFPEVNDNEF